MARHLFSIIFVVFIILVPTFFFYSQSSLTQKPDPKAPLKKNLKLAHYHETATEKGRVVVGDPNSQNTTELRPQVSLSKWDEVNLDISYNIGNSKPEAIDDGIVWKGNSQDLIYKEIKANQPVAQNKIPKKPVIQLASNLNDVRLLRFGNSTLSKIASSYELFEQSASPDPTITTYIPGEDGYFFFGYKEADKDLINPRDIKYPIVRLKADQENFTCPVIPFTKNGGFVIRFYKPGLSNNGGHFRDQMVKAINLALQKEGVTKKIERRIDFLYYMDGIRPVQVGRIGYDTNNLILYLYTNSPLQGGPLQDNVRIQLLLRDTLFPFSDLKSLKPDITAVFGDKIVNKFLELENLNGITDTLTTDEEALLRGLEGLQQESDWKYEAKRSDLSHHNNTGQFDKFEFDILLHQVPDSNVFTYQIDTEGLDFFYQPELSEEEKNNGSYQPENVVGSYAVYKKEASPLYDNPIDAEKYKTGKVMHIYRPKVIDDKGDWIWGELNVDAQKGILTVTVDKNWLQKAAYPVLVDPTFGYTTAGGSTVTNRNMMFGSLFSGVNGIVSSISIRAYFVKNYVYGGIYRHEDSTLVDSSTGSYENGYGDGIGSAWYTLAFETPPAITSDTEYVLTSNNITLSKDTIDIAYDAGTANQGHSQLLSSPTTFPDPATFSHNNNVYSIYATYEATGGPVNFRGNVNLKGNVNLR